MEFSPEDILGFKWFLGKVTADFWYVQQAKTWCSTQVASGILPRDGTQSWANQYTNDCFHPDIGRSYVFAIQLLS